MFTHENIFGAPQQPFGGDVSIFLPMRSSAGIDRRPEPSGRGGDFFYGGERMQPIRGASSSGRKDVQAGFYRSWLYGWKTGLRVGAGPSIESVVMLSSSGELVQRLDPFRPAARRFPLRGFRVRRG